MNVYVPSAPEATTIQPVTKTITGWSLAYGHLNARDRARLAADIIDGRVMIDASSLTKTQIIKICRANAAYVAEARFPERMKRLRHGRLPKAFNKIEFDSRVELCRVIGAERVWNALAAAID